MSNGFSKQELVLFEQQIEGFEDALVMSELVSGKGQEPVAMERSGDIFWRTMPYIALSYDGTDMTSNYQNITQLSVPASLGYAKSVPWTMTASEERDPIQAQRMSLAAARRLASDVNVSISNTAALTGTQVVTRSGAASGYDDVSQADAIFNEIGVPTGNRVLALSPRDYNSMAGGLADKQTFSGAAESAYRNSIVGRVAGFDTYKLDYAYRLPAAATGIAATVNGNGQYYTPESTSTATTGERSNVDNRYQDLNVTVTSGIIKVGDCFTIGAVQSVHMITKQPTGQLATFRVASIVSGAGGSGTIRISPPIISGTGGTDAELQYKNVTITPANGTAINFLNTASAPVNTFWVRDAIELIPGTYAIQQDAGTKVMTSSTPQGLQLSMLKFFDIDTLITKYRLDCRWGVVNKQPQMSGIILFNQS